MHEPAPATAASPSQWSRVVFVDRFASIYEHSPWVAEQVFDAGLTTTDDTLAGLAAHMAAAVDAASDEEQMRLIRAHPDLGARAGRTDHLSAASQAEQADAGLAHCSASEYAELQTLNRAYTDRFGFPFIIAVKGMTRQDILVAMRARLENDAATERARALTEIHRIAHARLAALMS
ncbi:2-oxo-4-hydroxy-4-carboxy-5-ureidoimidazoline decarboxylase [Salinisphaera sp. Q1T1-3]|nr:2-oxo-4-hydroxy-4-carboxy-5-ureidoimidazoline decarboxylase [Salinisphaera sp. Q1T1-3]